ncbi:hypothetical protein Fmac_025954 [Flemingia macrophylla]|uniref:Secreted protein n=1 Tax=Flemingia macrophylla TaxID=520843 RepID=A0ABD1LF44_9FABA
MGLHVVALAKLHLRPAAIGLACPVVLKVLMGFRVFRDDALYQSRLFLFQLGQIAFSRVPHVARMERALRLIWRTLTPTPTPPTQNSEIVENSLHHLSMLSL